MTACKTLKVHATKKISMTNTLQLL